MGSAVKNFDFTQIWGGGVTINVQYIDALMMTRQYAI